MIAWMNPPPTPMFGAARTRGRTNAGVSNMTEAFTAVAGSLAEVISPKQANSDSPTKAVNLRGKYIQTEKATCSQFRYWRPH